MEIVSDLEFKTRTKITQKDVVEKWLDSIPDSGLLSDRSESQVRRATSATSACSDARSVSLLNLSIADNDSVAVEPALDIRMASGVSLGISGNKCQVHSSASKTILNKREHKNSKQVTFKDVDPTENEADAPPSENTACDDSSKNDNDQLTRNIRHLLHNATKRRCVSKPSKTKTAQLFDVGSITDSGKFNVWKGIAEVLFWYISVLMLLASSSLPVCGRGCWYTIRGVDLTFITMRNVKAPSKHMSDCTEVCKKT